MCVYPRSVDVCQQMLFITAGTVLHPFGLSKSTATSAAQLHLWPFAFSYSFYISSLRPLEHKKFSAPFVQRNTGSLPYRVYTYIQFPPISSFSSPPTEDHPILNSSKRLTKQTLAVEQWLWASDGFLSLLQSFDLPICGIGPGRSLHTALEFHKLQYWPYHCSFSFLLFSLFSTSPSTLILSTGQRESTENVICDTS